MKRIGRELFLQETFPIRIRREDKLQPTFGPPRRRARCGDKAAARAAAAAAGVPTVPGSEGIVEDLADARACAEEIGYPVMIKASAGGGGRGIKVAENADDLATLISQARAEAEAAFGDGGLYLEKLVRNARHIEVQVLGDGKDAVHFFERECSLQRRRQKVWEEAPSLALDDATRQALCESALGLARSVGYRGAGTLEFLYDDATGAYYFIEMNTRIQVEHPVTEMVTGFDLVAEMIRIAGGEPLGIAQDDIRLSGHAIECRINAENPAMDFLPNPGAVTAYRAPEGPGVRFDTMLYEGYEIPPFYDSLLGKLIVHAESRDQAMDRVAAALADLTVEGIHTTIPLHQQLAGDADIRAGRFHTQFLEPWLEANPIPSD